MITEFTCGIYHALKSRISTRWSLQVNGTQIALIEIDGSTLSFGEHPPILTHDDLLEIAVLMNHIKRQHKQLQTA